MALLSEATEVINEIPVKLSSPFLIYKITTSFEETFDPLSMNIITEVEKLEPGPTFENTINDIKYDINDIRDSHMKTIAFSTMNISAITLSENNFKQLSMNSIIEVEKFKPEPTFEKTINDIKYDCMKSIASSAMNLSAITLFDENIEKLVMNSRIEVEKIEPEPTFEKTVNDIKDDNLKIITSIEINVSAITPKKPSSYS